MVTVAVAGCGVIGLSTGISLALAGHTVKIYSKQIPPTVLSNFAGAVWLPLLVGDESLTPVDYVARLERWSTDTWDVLVDLIDRDAGISWIKSHEMFRSRRTPLPFLRTLLPEFIETSDDTLPSGNTYRWSFSTLLIEPPKYLAYLMRWFKELGGEVAIRNIESVEGFQELKEDVIFNCTGLGSRELFAESGLKAVKGQLLLHEPVHLDAAIGADEFVILPRADALILGSLFQEEYEDEAPSKENDELLWSTISKWIRQPGGVVGLSDDALSREKIIGSVAALRPYRARGVCIDRQQLGKKHLIHDYGHGGSGLTLSWGCAKHAISLAQDLLQ